ncbi:MAG: polysulfide reductase NrfD [Nitrospirota bacterium]|nr:polysulfide reductase NrfD [Nitrospirota bacterium]
MERNPDSSLSWIHNKLFLGMTFRNYLKSNLTLSNGIAVLILVIAIPVMIYRFVYGLGPSTNLSDTNPWGIWIGVDVLSGIALAAGGLVIGTLYYLFGMKEYHHFVRPAVLTSLLGYLFAVFALLFDLGRYYRLPYPMVVSYGLTSIMFLVAWHFALYILALLIEWSPALFEWLNLRKLREWFNKMAIWATVFGVIIAGGHQSALGALFLIAPSKLHPLWYSELLPIFFLISAIIAGLSMVIFESTLIQKVFKKQVEHFDNAEFDRLINGLGKGASAALFTYFFLKLLGLASSNNWGLLNTLYGYLFLFELMGFILLPAFLFAYGVRYKNGKVTRWTALLTVVGIVLNRINTSIIAFNWNAPERYYPLWTEVVITIGIITMGVLTFRWIVNRMAILYDHPEYKSVH